MIPQTYEEWVKCITVGCKIDLTAQFAKERIEALRDSSDAHTKRYVGMYGEAYRDRVIGWFERSLEEQEAA